MEQELQAVIFRDVKTGALEDAPAFPPAETAQPATVTDLLWVTTDADIIEEESSIWCAFTGQRGADLKNWHWLVAFHPDDRAAIKTTWQQPADAFQSSKITCRIRRSDGVYCDYQVHILPLLAADNCVHEWIALGTDITVDERTRMEEEEKCQDAHQKVSPDLLHLLLDMLPASVCLVQGSEARLVFANQTAAVFWRANWPVGQPMQEFLRAHDIRILGTDGEILPLEEMATFKAVRGGETVRRYQERIRFVDGSTLPVSVDAIVLKQPLFRQLSGMPAKVEPASLLVYQDMTVWQEAEHLKDRFVGMAAHELRQPLTILKGFTQSLIKQTARGKGPALADWQKKIIGEIEQATTRLENLTTDLLDVTRLQAEGPVLHCQPLDLAALGRQVVMRLQATTDRHQISFKTSRPRIVVSVDQGRIEQVILNLLENAIKYSPEGGPVEITLRNSSATHIAILSIRDHGIGIPTQQQARIFGQFVRADNARAAGISGTGLGLYLSQKIIEQHGGRLWFASTEGEGSTFSLSLPLFPEPPGEKTESAG